MKITVEFENEDEFEAFRVSGKKTRARKGDTAEAETAANVPAPALPPAGGSAMQAPVMQPTAGFPGATGFAPPAVGATQAGGAFPVAAAPALVPEVQALVTRISNTVDNAIKGGQPAASVLQWFQGECVKLGFAEAQNATLDQIKTLYLPKMNQSALENIAKLMNA